MSAEDNPDNKEGAEAADDPFAGWAEALEEQKSADAPPGDAERADDRPHAHHRIQEGEGVGATVERPLSKQWQRDLELEGQRADHREQQQREPQPRLAPGVAQPFSKLTLRPRDLGR